MVSIDRIAVLQSGVLVAVDAPSKVMNNGLIQHVFNYPVEVTDHPQYKNRPLVVPMLPADMHNLN
jgi:iron complex transport system ATP-binding protein